MKSKVTCNLIELAVRSVLPDKSQTKELNSHGYQFLPVLQNQNKDLITACCCFWLVD